MKQIVFNKLATLLAMASLTACGGGSGSDNEEGGRNVNAAPSASNVQITDVNGGNVNIGDVLSASYHYQDSDNDEAGVSVYQWLRNGVAIASAQSKNYTLVSEDGGQDISFAVTPMAVSGVMIGSIYASNTLSVQPSPINSPPKALAVSIVDVNAGLVMQGDILQVSYQYEDAENDPEQGTVLQWYRGEAPIENANAMQYTLTMLDQGRQISIRVIPKAQTGSPAGEEVTATIKVTDNFAPTVSHVVISADSLYDNPRIGDELTGAYKFNDADGDTEGATRLRWLRNGEEILGQETASYVVTGHDVNKTLAFQVTPVSLTGTKEGASISSSTLTVSMPIERALSWHNNNVDKSVTGTSLNNPATTQGPGEVRYSSSQPSIATVDENGVVNFLAQGTVQISAEVNGNATHSAASAHYIVDVQHKSFAFEAWIGGQDTKVHFNDDLTGIEMYRSTDADCSVFSFYSCENNEQTSLSNSAQVPAINDGAATLQRAAHYQFKFGNYLADAQVSPRRFTTKTGMALVTFKGKLWAIGGSLANGGNNEVWSSIDGRSWQQEVTDSSQIFSPRRHHQVREFKGKLWITGGQHYVSNNYLYFSDVWSSADGIHWQLENDAAEFGGRSNHQMTVANDRLWLSGHQLSSHNDVWSSADGINWQEEGLAPSGYMNSIELETLKGQNGEPDQLMFNRYGNTYVRTNSGGWELVANGRDFRSGSSMVLHDNKLWLISTQTNRLMYSGNGQDWTTLTDLNFPPIYHQGVTAFDGKLWLIGGSSEDHTQGTTTYSSADGQNWKVDMDGTPYKARYYPATTSFNNRLFTIGGYSYGYYLNDVWASDTGASWQRQFPTEAETGIERIAPGQAVAFKGKLWYSTHTTLYSSVNGKDWVADKLAPMPTKGQFQLVVVNDQLWILSGSDNGAWVAKSDDGVSWDLMDTAASGTIAFGSNQGFRAVSFNGRVWAVGGYKNRQRNNEIWSSVDGIDWQQVTVEGSVFSPRMAHTLTVWQDKMWLVAGNITGYSHINDVWSSADGIHWQQELEQAPFSPGYGFGATVHNDKLVLTGGNQDSSEVWATEDGINWRKAFSGQVKFSEILAP